MQRTAIALLLALTATASADSKTIIVGRNGYHLAGAHGGVAASTADTHILFMNKCTGGCTVTAGNTDNRSDTSDIAQSTSRLSAWNQSDSVWQQTMTCMKATFAQFNVTVTDVDPGSTPHMEVMVAGVATELLGSQGNGVGGIADFPCGQIGQCDSFMPNALVFAFANDSYYANAPLDICATAAQEIAHTWALDHVVDATDPMTYNQYNGMRMYKDNQACGSDCQGGQSPFGSTCSGSGGQATHVCAGTGQATQNEIQTINALFGNGAPDTTPPVVAITSPNDGASVQPGFTVTANVTDDIGVASAELKLDGASVGVVTTPPYTWKTPSNLTQGSHRLQVIGTDDSGNTASATSNVVFGSACTQNSDCSSSTDICDSGHCVAGPSSPGGLGAMCTSNTDCTSGDCANDGQGNQYCVEPCDPGTTSCPNGFACTPAGTNNVCWPNGDAGSTGGCNTSTNSNAPLWLVLGLGIVFVVKRGR